MTLAAAWCTYENPESPTLWMASDSRISDAQGMVIDEGIKLYEVPIICWRPGTSGFFDTPHFVSAVGVIGAGGSLVFQHVYGTLVAVLGNLIHPGGRVPSVEQVAALADRVTTTYVRSLGLARPEDAWRITLIVGGQTPRLAPQAFLLAPEVAGDGIVKYTPAPLDLGPNSVHFIGAEVELAQRLLSDFVQRDEPGASRDRAALNVIRALIDDPNASAIGGEVQIGHMVGSAFRRVASVVSDSERPQRARMLLNSIDLEEIGPVGPCDIGLQGMVSP
jgi:hypothetical protein